MIETTNDELVTVREAMRGLHQMVNQLNSGEREKFVLMHRNQMVAVVVPLELWVRVGDQAQRNGDRALHGSGGSGA